MKNQNQELSAAETLKQFEMYLTQGNIGAVAEMMGQGAEYCQDGPHWRGKWEIDLYHDALKQAAKREEAEKKHI